MRQNWKLLPVRAEPYAIGPEKQKAHCGVSLLNTNFK